MKLSILDVQENLNKKSGEVKYKAIALGTFSSYGNSQPATVEVSLNQDQYNKLKSQKDKVVDLDIVIPLPTFPLSLNSLNI